MAIVNIPQSDWNDFLESFTRQHRGWLIRIETSDLHTKETVTSEFWPLESLVLDLEDEVNPRINLTVKSGNTESRHILFRPSRVTLYHSAEGADEALAIESVSTRTTLRFRVAIKAEMVDEVA